MESVEGYIPIISSPQYNILYVSKWTQEQKNDFADNLHQTIEDMRKMTPRGLLLEATNAIDGILAEELPLMEPKVPCKRGCDHCCYIAIRVTNPEAKVALDYAKLKGLEIDKARLKQQFLLGQDDESFMRMDHPQRRCVFLQNNGDCGIYEKRPLACRTYAVVSDPSECSTLLNPDATVKMVANERAGYVEALYTSAIAMKYGLDNVRPLHHFIYKWTRDDGLPGDTGAVQGQQKQVENAGGAPGQQG